MQLEADILEGAGIGAGQVADLQHNFFTGSMHLLGELVAHFPADHPADNQLLGQLRRRPAAHQLAVAHDGDLMGNLKDFIHLMGNIDNGDALRRQLADNPEQNVHFCFAQGRSGLVHNDDLCAVADGAGNLDQLAVCRSQFAHGAPGIDIDIQIIEKGLGILIHFLFIDPMNGTDFFVGNPTDPDIFHNIAGANGMQLLMNHGDAFIHGIPGIPEGDFLAFNFNYAFIGVVQAKGTLHQSGLACAVFAHQRVNRTFSDGEGHFVQCFDTRKRFADVFHFQHDARVIHPGPPISR